MVAAFGNFYVRGVAGSGYHARRQIVVEKRGRGSRQHAQIAFDGFEDALDFAGAHDGVDFGNLFEDLGAIAFHQAAGDD